MNDNTNKVKSPGRGFAWAFVFGGALGFATLVDLVRYIFQWNAPITTVWLLAIIFTGFMLGGFASLLLSKSRRRHGPTPNNRLERPPAASVKGGDNR